MTESRLKNRKPLGHKNHEELRRINKLKEDVENLLKTRNALVKESKEKLLNIASTALFVALFVYLARKYLIPSTQDILLKSANPNLEKLVEELADNKIIAQHHCTNLKNLPILSINFNHDPENQKTLRYCLQTVMKCLTGVKPKAMGYEPPNRIKPDASIDFMTTIEEFLNSSYVECMQKQTPIMQENQFNWLIDYVYIPIFIGLKSYFIDPLLLKINIPFFFPNEQLLLVDYQDQDKTELENLKNELTKNNEQFTNTTLRNTKLIAEVAFYSSFIMSFILHHFATENDLKPEAALASFGLLLNTWRETAKTLQNVKKVGSIVKKKWNNFWDSTENELKKKSEIIKNILPANLKENVSYDPPGNNIQSSEFKIEISQKHHLEDERKTIIPKDLFCKAIQHAFIKGVNESANIEIKKNEKFKAKKEEHSNLIITLPGNVNLENAETIKNEINKLCQSYADSQILIDQVITFANSIPVKCEIVKTKFSNGEFKSNILLRYPIRTLNLGKHLGKSDPSFVDVLKTIFPDNTIEEQEEGVLLTGSTPCTDVKTFQALLSILLNDKKNRSHFNVTFKSPKNSPRTVKKEKRKTRGVPGVNSGSTSRDAEPASGPTNTDMAFESYDEGTSTNSDSYESGWEEEDDEPSQSSDEKSPYGEESDENITDEEKKKSDPNNNGNSESRESKKTKEYTFESQFVKLKPDDQIIENQKVIVHDGLLVTMGVSKAYFEYGDSEKKIEFNKGLIEEKLHNQFKPTITPKPTANDPDAEEVKPPQIINGWFENGFLAKKGAFYGFKELNGGNYELKVKEAFRMEWRNSGRFGLFAQRGVATPHKVPIYELVSVITNK